jgi:hypothetical protein
MEYTLKLGEWCVVRRGWLSKYSVMFAGEASSGVYSAVGEWSVAHNSAAYNIYFHKSQRDFPFLGGRVTVVDVSRHELRFRFER